MLWAALLWLANLYIDENHPLSLPDSRGRKQRDLLLANLAWERTPYALARRRNLGDSFL